jgi:hypothetical protein
MELVGLGVFVCLFDFQWIFRFLFLAMIHYARSAVCGESSGNATHQTRRITRLLTTPNVTRDQHHIIPLHLSHDLVTTPAAISHWSRQKQARRKWDWIETLRLVFDIHALLPATSLQ